MCFKRLSQVERSLYLLTCLMAAVVLTASAVDDLPGTFRNPPVSAKPQIWWHWMDGNITKEGITADLEAMKNVGIGGVQIFNVGQRIPDGPAPYMSPQWMELFRFAAAEADRVGLQVCFHNCAGWSSSGGPWVKPEQAMQTIVTSETNIQGPIRFKAQLPQPPITGDYYKDIAVLAFPTPGKNVRIPRLDAKALFGKTYEYGLQPEAKAIDPEAIVPPGKIIDLTPSLKNGELTWSVPQGRWTILRVGHTLTGKNNAPAPVAGRGLEIDKLSRQALDAHWRDGVEPILKALGPLAGKTVNNALIDSYEVGCNNWTPKFREEFLKRRGYDPIPFLPVLSGRYVDSGEITERFLWDFRRTIGDLFAENYFFYFSELCKAHGLMSSIEPYNGPFECLQVGAKADIVMGEFWTGGAESASVKLAAEVAHTHGIPIVGAESFTATADLGRWLNHPGSLKSIGDFTWSQGLNRFIFHCYAHQPWMDKIPGMTMGKWGTHFGRYNTWWEQSRPWITYITRGQSMLQKGKPVTDVLFFGGEASPNGAVNRPDLKLKGYDYDAIGTDLICSLKVQNGLVVTPVGGSYRLLVLPDSTWMTPALARTTRDLVRAGAAVLAPKPQKSPSLANYPAADAEVAKIAEEVWGSGSGERVFGKGRVIATGTVESALAVLGLQPDFESLTPGSKVVYSHRRLGDADLYFVSNQRPSAASVDCAFRLTGRSPEIWDIETGSIQPAALWRVEGNRTIVSLTFEQSGSVFVVFRTQAPAPAENAFVKLAFEPADTSSPRRPKLEIRRARYGAFSFAKSGLVDVTQKVAAEVREGKLKVRASNDLGGDPSSNLKKELRVQYECNGRTNVTITPEGRLLELPRTGESGSVRVLGALYGTFKGKTKGLPALNSVDITHKLKPLVANNTLVTRANNDLAGGDPAYMVPKELRVEYSVDGVTKSVTVKENQELRLPEDGWSPAPPAPRAHIADEKLSLEITEPGTYTLTTAAGRQKSVIIPSVPEPIGILGPWTVEFQAGRGAPARASFEKLISWPDHPDTGIKHFSGTAVYRAKLSVPPGQIGSGRRLELDLGRVHVIAEVRLNGKDLGVLWKAPFRVDVTGAVKPGENDLEVRVTNLWPNRMIGDEQLPEDCEWNGDALKEWPEWVKKGQPRPVSDRVTFTTWKHWLKDSPLQPSGLIGPVVVRTVLQATVN